MHCGHVQVHGNFAEVQRILRAVALLLQDGAKAKGPSWHTSMQHHRKQRHHATN